MNDVSATWTSSAPFSDFLGVDVLKAEGGEVEIAFRCRPELKNRKGDIHGGVLASLIDLAASRATRSLGELKGVSTVTLLTNYIAPAQGTITIRATVLKAGRSTSFVDVRVCNADGDLAATGSVTLRIIR
ncbi:MAG: PaaI family thioesterase [Phyllobacterium sp.]